MAIYKRVNKTNGTDTELLGSVYTKQKGFLMGEDGATFTPHVDEDGTLSWTNNKNLVNPEPVNIKGPKGDNGTGSGNNDDTEGQTDNTSKTIILDPIVMLGANQGDMGRETVLAFLQQINVDEHKLYNDLINSTIDNAKVEGQMFNLITPTPQGQVPLTFPISSQILVKMDLSFLANDPDWQPHVFENANLILSFIIMGFDKQIPLLISIFQLDTVNKQIVGFGWKEIK